MSTVEQTARANMPSPSVFHGDCVDPEPAETVADRINALLRSSGPGYILRLCPGQKYHLQQPLQFAAENQEISTAGYPLGEKRATLVVSGSITHSSGLLHTVAVDGTLPGCSGAMLRNVQVDGNRRDSMPVSPLSGATILFGGVNDNQTVQYVKSYDPRGWSCLHVTEGTLSCKNATVQYNDIGPCGNDLPHEWADGISMSCKDSVVRYNTIVDATDGGIVVFSPGTQVYNNTIRVVNRTLLGGINLVDHLPWGGDLANTVVRDNILLGGYVNAPGEKDVVIKIGVAIGPRTWFGDKYLDNITSSGLVLQNRLSGAFIYGISLSSAVNFTVKENVMFDNYTFIGGPGPGCDWDGNITPAPAPFIYDTTTDNLTLQSNFELVLASELLTCTVPPNDARYWPLGPNSSSFMNNPGANTASDNMDRHCFPLPHPGQGLRKHLESPSWTLHVAACAAVLCCIVRCIWTWLARRLRMRWGKMLQPRRNMQGRASTLDLTVNVKVSRLVWSGQAHLEKRRAF